MESRVHREDTDFTVESGQEEHRVPLAPEPRTASTDACRWRDTDQPGHQDVGHDQPTPAGHAAGVTGEGDRCGAYIAGARPVDGEPVFREGPVSGHSQRSVLYQFTARARPVTRSVCGRHPVSCVSWSARHVQAGARNSFALSAVSMVARPKSPANDPMAHKRPRATSAGTGRTMGILPTARPMASTRDRLVWISG